MVNLHGHSPTRLEPGQREYRGYCEWAVHPLEAEFVLARGYAIVDGQPRRVQLVHEEEFVTQILVDGSDPVFEEPGRLEAVA
jgi:hypothetical protein